MGENMQGMKRTHYCGEVDERFIGQTVTVMGWVNKRRYLSQLIFIVLRDRTGIVQVTVDETKVPPERYQTAKAIRGEYVVAASGVVVARTEENINPNMPTGKIEIDVTELRVLSEADVPPFQVADTDVGNDLRLKYRYIDLRRPSAQQILWTRHKAAQAARNFLCREGFIEIETPVLTKSSPEGARDYLVASRTYPGHFYALPQSPQIFKQVLMIAGFDKYYQIVKCFRDEDLRADRQPEFTQIDIELSFVDEADIMALSERMMQCICKEAMGLDIAIPFQRMTYREAMERFGSDKPDLRFGMELRDISELVQGCPLPAFQTALENGGSVRGINANGCAAMPRKQIDAMVELVKEYKAKGLAWITLTESGAVKSSLTKFLSPEQLQAIIHAFDGKPGDLIFICADSNAVVFDALGALRVAVAKKNNLIDPSVFRFLWVTEFPVLEWSEEDGRFYAKHHPFTAPMEEDWPLLETRPADARARAYDMVLNGYELGGGSIRMHRREQQDAMFNVLGFTPEAAQRGFGFFLEALKYGTPPHGGLALGLDRIAMLFTGADSLREVIAFPKVKDASCPMTDAPSKVDEQQLAELGVTVHVD